MGTGADFLSMAQTWIGRESHHHRRAEIRSRPYFLSQKPRRPAIDKNLNVRTVSDNQPNARPCGAQ